MSDMTVSYLLQAKTEGLASLQLFRNELAQLKQVQSGFRADVGFGQQQAASVRAATQALTEQIKAVTQLTAALRAQGRMNTISIKIEGTQQAINDVGTLRTILGALQTSTNIRITTDVQALQAVNAQIASQITQLTALIAQLRGLGSGGGPGPGGGGAGGLPSAVRSTLLEIERLNNLWTRGQIGAQNYSQALGAMQSRLEAARSAAGRGTEEFAQIDRQITKLTASLRGINTDSLTKIKTDMAAVRTAFDQATGGISRDSQQFRDAAAAYQTGAAQIEARLKALAQQGNLTAAQMGQVNRTLGTLAREQGTLSGGLNTMGLSGNAFNAIRAAFPLLMQAGGSLGAAAASANMFGQGMASAGAAAGPLGLAIGGVVVGLGLFVKTATEGLEQVKQLQNAFAVLRANGETDLAGVNTSLDRLKQSGNAAAETFTKGQLGAALADIVKAGVSTSDALRLVATSTRLAASENQDLTVSSSMLLKNLRQYQLGVGDAAKVGDMLAESGLLAAGSVADLSTGMGIVAGTGRAAKVEMYDLLGMLVELDNKGMSAADVGANGLRAALAALAGITDKGKASLHALGIETVDAGGHSRAAGDIMVELSGKLRDMGVKADASTGMLVGNGDALAKVSDIMDTRAAAAILNLTGDWKTYAEQIRDSQGRLTEYSNTMLNTLDGSQRRMAASLKDLGENITKFLAEPITKAANGFNDLITQLNGGSAGFSRYLQQAGIDGTQLDGAVNQHLQKLFEQRQIMADRLDLLDHAPLLKMGFEGQYADFSKRLPQVIAEMKRIVEDAKAGRKTVLSAPGQDGAPVALDPTVGGKVVDATKKPLDDHEAQALVDRCDRYVRLVLGKAFPSIASQINTLFQSNPGPGGIPTAVSTAANLSSAGLLKPFTGTGSLQPGDVIFYTDRGQNHTGVWLGDGNYVRGNNRVTYSQSNGKQAVGDVDINSLGSPTSVLSVAELAARYGIKAPPIPAATPKPSGTTTNGGSSTAPDLNANLKRAQAEGLHLYEQYQAALASGNKVWRDKALLAIEGFKKENKAVWTGILADHKKGGDDQGAITAAQIIKAQKYQATLLAAQKALKDNPGNLADTKAVDAAQRAMDKWSKASESNARALSIVQRNQESANKAAGQYIATQADLNRYGERALTLVKAQELANKSGNDAAVAKADADMAAFTKDARRAAVVQVEQTAYAARQQAQNQAEQEAAQAVAEAEQAKEKAATDYKKAVEEQEKARQQVVQQARDLDVKGAQLSFNGLKQLRDAELRDVGDNVVKKLAIQERYRLDLQHSQEAIALAQLKIDKAAANSGPAQNREKGISNAYTTYYQALFDAKDTSEVTKATSDQTDAVRKQRDAYSKLADQMRDAIKAGGMDAEAKHDWMVTFNDLGRETEKLGLTNDHYVEGARKATYALTAQSDSIHASLGSINEAVAQTDTLLDGLDARLQDLRETEQIVSDLRQAALGQGIPDGAPPIDNRDTDPTQRPDSAASNYLKALGLAPDAFAALASTTIPDAMQEATTPEQYAGLGATVLRGLVDGLADKAGWEKVRDAMQAGLNQALETDALVAQAPVVPGINTGNMRADDVGFGGQLTPAPQTDWEKNQTQINRQGILDSLKDMNDAQLDEEKAFAAGIQDVELYNAVLAELKDRAEKAAKAVKDLAEKQAKDQQDATDKAVKATEDFMKAQQEVGDAEAKVAEAMGEKQPLYRSEIQALENLKLQYPELAARIQLVIDAYLQLRKAGDLDALAAGAEKLGQGLASIFDGFGMGDWGKVTSSLGSIPKLLKSGMDAVGDFQGSWAKFSGDKSALNFGGLLGSIGGVAGAVGAAISLIGGLGDAIMRLDPAYQLWKKNTLEQASAEQSAMGSKTYGNIANPYYDKLKADSEALTTKANAGFWQRLGWSLFGGAPETLDKAASDALVKASNIFSDFAQSINGSLESVLLDATDNADFSKVGDALDKQMNKLIQTYALRAIIAKSNLSKFIQQFADDSAAGKDTTVDLANIRSERDRITTTYESLAPSLPGYGSSMDTTGSSTSTAGTSTFGAVPQSVQVAISTPLLDAATLYDTATKRFDASTLRFEAAVARMEAMPPPTSGNSGSGGGTQSLR